MEPTKKIEVQVKEPKKYIQSETTNLSVLKWTGMRRASKLKEQLAKARSF
jgi:hypothetical protein